MSVCQSRDQAMAPGQRRTSGAGGGHAAHAAVYGSLLADEGGCERDEREAELVESWEHALESALGSFEVQLACSRMMMASAVSSSDRRRR